MAQSLAQSACSARGGGCEDADDNRNSRAIRGTVTPTSPPPQLPRLHTGSDTNEQLTLSPLYSPRRLSSSRSAPRPSLESELVLPGKFHSRGGKRMRELGSGDGEEGWELFPCPSSHPPCRSGGFFPRGTRSPHPTGCS